MPQTEGVTENGKNISLDALGTAITQVGLFKNSTDTEVSGGTYARQRITFNSATSANLDSSNVPTFDIPASANFDQARFFNAGGTLLAVADLPEETYGSAGTYPLDDFDISFA